MKNKIFLSVLIVFMGVLLIFTYKSYATNGDASGTCGNNITWTLDDEGTLTITGSGDMNGTKCAWENYREQVKNVIFEGNITSISDCAFEYNANIETIKLPETVESIGRRSFAECSKLNSIIFPKGLTEIGASAFYNCTNLDNVELEEDLIYIRVCAFAGCTSLKNITIKSDLVLVGNTDDNYDYMTISDTAHIYGHKYSGTYYYATLYGRTFTDIKTNETYNEKITNQDYLDALPKEKVENIGIVSNNGAIGSPTINSIKFCNEKDETNSDYRAIQSKVDELTNNCTTQKDKAKAIFNWIITNITYKYNYGATANIDTIYYYFNEKTGNCEAYTMLTNYMLYLCGIPTATVRNSVHAWSAAYIDGEWIYIDTTHYIFGNTDERANEIIFAYDGLVYVIDIPSEGGKVVRIAKTDEEINQLKSFTIPTNTYMKSIYKVAFDEDIELRAENGTIGAEFIKENRLYCDIENNYIIGTNTKTTVLKGDINNDGKVTLYDAFRILRNVILGGNLTEEQKDIMDYNDDGKVTLYDAFRFLRQVILA